LAISERVYDRNGFVSNQQVVTSKQQHRKQQRWL